MSGRPKQIEPTVTARGLVGQKPAGLVRVGNGEGVHDQRIGDDVTESVGAHHHGGELEGVEGALFVDDHAAVGQTVDPDPGRQAEHEVREEGGCAQQAHLEWPIGSGVHTLRHHLRSAVDSFWFVPALLLLAAVVLAELMVALDRAVGNSGLASLPFVSAIGASGSRDLLAAIGGSMLGVAATSFSITISVIATASSTFGPRLVRNFMANRGNQVVLGIYGATFLYALLVLRTVREGADDASSFVPHLAVTFAIGLAVVDVAVLIYFIHHIADSIQVPTLATQVLKELLRTTDHSDVEPTRSVGEHDLAGSPTSVVRATRHGFVQFVDHPALVKLAVDLDAVLVLRPLVGDHVIDGDVLVEVRGNGSVPADVKRRVERALTFGSARTTEQDRRFAVQQIAEMAVRAMSPGTNDPYTAINAIIEIGTGLSPLMSRADPGNAYEHEGTVRLVHPSASTADLIDLVFDQIRPFSLTSADVVLALLDLRRILAEHTERPELLLRLADQEEALLRQFDASGPDQRERQRIGQR